MKFKPTSEVVSAYKRGLKLHEAGNTGDGLESATVAQARKIAEGGSVTEEWARKANRFWGRNSRFLQEPKDSAAYASAMLWGGAAGRDWYAKIYKDLEANMKKVFVNFINEVNVSNISTTEIEGDEYIVIPSKTLPDNVIMNGGLYPPEEIEKGYKSLEGVTAPFGHPIINGAFVSATDAVAIDKFHIGAHVANVRRKDGIVLHDTLINKRVAQQTEDGRSVLAAINKGQPIHTSTGLMAQRVEKSGVCNSSPSKDKNYDWIATNLHHDHNAILLNEDGAATPMEGVGMLVNEKTVDVQFCNLDAEYGGDSRSLIDKIVEAVASKFNLNQTEEADPMKDKMVKYLEKNGVDCQNMDDDAIFGEYTKRIKNGGDAKSRNAEDDKAEPKKAEANSQALTAEAVAEIVNSAIDKREAANAKTQKEALVSKVIANSAYTDNDKETLMATPDVILNGFIKPKAQVLPHGAGFAANSESSLLNMKMEGAE